MAKNRVVLFLVDGMRPDGMQQAETPNMDAIMRKGTYTLKAKTVMPSVTLPTHMSLFHSVKPDRHNTLTNTYAPQVRPISGLIEVIHQAEMVTAMCYNWEQLRDLSRPGSLTANMYFSINHAGMGESDRQLTKHAISWLTENPFHFAFIYLGQVDEFGHNEGWMSEPYLEAIEHADACIGQVMGTLGEDVHYMVTADHGGHGSMHGTPKKKDMIIPFLMCGPEVYYRGKLKEEVSIIDIAPTILKILKLDAPAKWKGIPIF
jgi:predicted AlkP superfamily pyrophosphatase or phosphodiesterase